MGLYEDYRGKQAETYPLDILDRMEIRINFHANSVS